jgi:hypothetical protein
MCAWGMSLAYTSGTKLINDWTDIETAFDDLDGKTHLYLRVSVGTPVSYIEIFSSDEEHAIVEYRRGATKKVLYNVSPTRTVALQAEGSSNDALVNTRVDKSLAKEALKHFSRTGEMLETLPWGEWSSWPPVWCLYTKNTEQGISDWKQLEDAVDTMGSAYDSFLAVYNMRNPNSLIRIQSTTKGDRVVLKFREHPAHDSFFLADPSQTLPILVYYLSGTVAAWPPEYGIDRELAKKALKHFYETQERDLSFEWRVSPGRN